MSDGRLLHITVADADGQVLARVRQQSPDRYEVLSPRGTVLGSLALADPWTVYSGPDDDAPALFSPDVFALAVEWAEGHAVRVAEGYEDAVALEGGCVAEGGPGLAGRARSLSRGLCNRLRKILTSSGERASWRR